MAEREKDDRVSEAEKNLARQDHADNERTAKDAALRIGATHGEATGSRYGYARDIGPEGAAIDAGPHSRTKGAGLTEPAKLHPSKSLNSRSRGFGIGGGYERPYKKEKAAVKDSAKQTYGPMPHAGYYGAGQAARPFKVGQAGFREEMIWYRDQYGEKTSDYEK